MNIHTYCKLQVIFILMTGGVLWKYVSRGENNNNNTFCVDFDFVSGQSSICVAAFHLNSAQVLHGGPFNNEHELNKMSEL